MRSSLRVVVAASVVAGGVLAACSTNSPGGAFDAPQGGTSSSKGGSGGGAAGTNTAGTTGNTGGAEAEAGTGGSGTAGTFEFGGSSDGGEGGSESCGGDSVEATPAPLDLFIMLDQSGSMNEIAEGTTTKWKAVGLALGAFMTDKRSVGIGAGLQYFPNQIEAPTFCTSDASCNGLGTCGVPKVCSKKANGSSSYSICEDDESCVNVGIVGAKCVPFGDIPGGSDAKQCLGVECRLDEYGTPDVPITEIPAAIDLFAASLGKHKPKGGTPTGPALQGAIQYATQWATDHPDHKVAVVLATDGLPTQCQPINKDGIAAFAQAGRPLVDTYVIGVFSKTVDLDLVKANLNAVAQAGAERDAFLITTGGNAANDFADAMAEIRTSALPCDFAIPEQSSGAAIDFGKVNVNLTDADENVTELLYSTDEAGCDPDAGGWYYDADPKLGGTPTQVKLCPSSCQAYRSQPGSKIATLFGCETKITPPPK
jgi:hypothetical protein